MPGRLHPKKSRFKVLKKGSEGGSVVRRKAKEEGNTI